MTAPARTRSSRARSRRRRATCTRASTSTSRCTPGELVVVRGASGAGKTTLLNLLGGLDRPTSGRVWIGDVEATALDEDALAQLRREQLGFVFQSFGLIPVLSAAENVELPLRIAARRSGRARRSASPRRCALVGLADHAAQRPGELSGGQQQRVGIARAIVARPRVLIADEPTGQLDSRTAATVMDLHRRARPHPGHRGGRLDARPAARAARRPGDRAARRAHHLRVHRDGCRGIRRR